MFRGRRTYEKQEVLKGISFDIKKGEFFGIVGRNGSGKSTLLKLLAGIYTPDRGAIQINGKLTPFIELGVGFNPELTGRENVFLNGALLGFNRKEMQAMYNEIVEFAELEKFMDQKLKNYSSGMQVRLAFSIAIRAESDILLLDEVLAVGDEAFQRKCTEYFADIKRSKQTIILVTHDMTYVERFCDRAMVLDRGEVLHIGKSATAKKDYERLNRPVLTDAPAHNTEHRWGSGEAKIEKCYLGSKHDDNFVEVGSEMVFTFELKSKKDIPVVLGIAIEDSAGLNIAGPNTGKLRLGSNQKVQFEINKIPLNPGRYYVRAVLFDEDTIKEYDHLEKAITFDVVSGGKEVSHGKIDLFGNWRIKQ
jgi:ABC-2 type transport system ATP-binding protein